jgi:hypothetical protein
MEQLSKSTGSMDIEQPSILVDQGTETTSIIKNDVSIQCDLSVNDIIPLPILVTTSAHKYCAICRCHLDAKPAIVIPEDIRLAFLVDHTIYLPPGARCCNSHFRINILSTEVVTMIQNNYPPVTSISIQNVNKFISNITSDIKKSTATLSLKKQAYVSFDNPFIYSDDDYFILIGISKVHFNLLCDKVEMRNTENRSVSFAVGCLLTKLRLGLSDQVLSTIFSVGDRRMIGHFIESARKALINDFVPFYLGLQHMTREVLIKDHTRPLAKQLLTNGTDVAILVLDGTYIYTYRKVLIVFFKESCLAYIKIDH